MQPRLLCIVADRSKVDVTPDTGRYSPKELADKEGTSTTAVYGWLKEGLPHIRQGDRGKIFIYYQDYINWAIHCAMKGKEVDLPVWAYWAIRNKLPVAR